MKFTHANAPTNDSFFSIEAFKSPRTEFYPAFTWTWSDPLSKEEIKRQLDEYAANDVRFLYILPQPKNFRPNSMPTNLEPDYLTEGYFEMYRYAAEYALEKGMQLWLYDEGGWPSGSACGLVLKNKPHLSYRQMDVREMPSPYEPGSHALAAFCEGKRVAAGFESDKPILEYYHKMKNMIFPNIGDAETTDEFIRLTHEEYKKHLGHLFGKGMTAVFTDEPHVSRLGFYPGFEEKFKERYGYDLFDHLPELFADFWEELDEAGKQVRVDYHDLWNEVFAENFFLKCRDWCHENNLLFTGHLAGEHVTLDPNQAFHHIMRLLRCMDIPGIDTIWRQIFPGQENHFFPRFAGSAANQTGNPYAVSESFAIYGAGLTFEQMRYVMLYQMSRGINRINIMQTAYSYDGSGRKDARPGFVPTLPTWRHLKDYCGYTARMSYLMSLGVPETRCAVYMPMTDIWSGGAYCRQKAEAFDRAVFALEAQHTPCDIMDDDFLETASVENGSLVTGTAAYTSVVIPNGVHLPEAARKTLNAFRKAGGLVVSADEVSRIERGAEITGAKVNLAKRRLENGMLYLLTNEHTEADTVSVAFLEQGNVYEIDALHSELYTYDGKPFELASGEGKVFLVTDGEYEAKAHHRFTRGEITVAELEIRRESSFVIGDEAFEKHEIDEGYTPTAPGDWCELYGSSFSGTVLYRVKFALDEIPDAIEIDLGKVGYSCDLTLNGKPLGSMCFAPFTCVAEKALLKRENELTVRVCNTPANQYTAAKWLDEIPRHIIGPYHEIAKQFENETLASGLMSPVVIRY